MEKQTVLEADSHEGFTAAIGRRDFLRLGALGATVAASGALLTACAAPDAKGEAAGKSSDPASEPGKDADAPVADKPVSLPPADPNPDNPFGVDKNINMDTIDQYLELPGVAYRDMRLVFDPADYAAIGGSPNLEFALKGFLITPMPYIGALAPLPVSGAYEGDCLFDIEWGEGIEILSAQPRYQQSQQIIDDLFPKDQDIFLMCGGAGYAGMMRSLLVYLGWDPQRVYNIGGMWDYTGFESVELMRVKDDGATDYFLWRADMPIFEFSQYTAL